MPFLYFPVFYRRATIFFYVVYIGLIVYGLFFYDRIPMEETERLQMVPFATLAAYIEAISKTASCSAAGMESAKLMPKYPLSQKIRTESANRQTAPSVLLSSV